MTDARQITIDPLTTCSLLLKATVNGRPLGTATGFCVRKADSTFLITNWHVVSGRNADTGALLSTTGAVPDQFQIMHHASRGLGDWVIRTELLHNPDGSKRWFEHPRGNNIDVVALPIAVENDVAVYPLDLRLADFDMLVQVAMPVSIIGFPYGLSTAGAWPIWKTGHIASDHDLDYDGRPAFLIDATTRGGMSGSPVVLRVYGGYATSQAGMAISGDGSGTRFLGVYSGRIHDQAEIGRVWRPSVVRDILDSVP